MAKGNFIEYVVSDNPNAFPDGDAHSDGFFYELFDGSGAYVWKKYQANTYIELTNPSATVIMKSGANNGSATTAISFMSPDFDYTPSDWAQFLDGFIITDENSALNYLMYSEGTLYISSTQGDLTNAVTITDPSTNSSALIDLTFSTSIAMKLTSSGTIEYSGTKQCPLDTATKGDFIDYVVSDSPTAYPDGGVQDGYWYEKVVEGIDLKKLFGYTKIVIDKFTLSSDTAANSKDIYHSLGETPKRILVVSECTSPSHIADVDTIYSGDEYSMGLLVGYYWTGNTTKVSVRSGSSTSFRANADYLFSTSSTNWKAGVEYTLITMA